MAKRIQEYLKADNVSTCTIQEYLEADNRQALHSLWAEPKPVRADQVSNLKRPSAGLPSCFSPDFNTNDGLSCLKAQARKAEARLGDLTRGKAADPVISQLCLFASAERN